MKDNTQFKETHFGILTFAIAKKNIFKLRLYQLLLEQESKSDIRSTLFFTFIVKPNIEYIYIIAHKIIVFYRLSFKAGTSL